MFENFEPRACSDNRHCAIEQDEQDDIIIGASGKHVFIVPKIYTNLDVNEFTDEQNIQDIAVFYKQGLYQILEKHLGDPDMVITDIEGTDLAKIEIILNPWDTVNFRKNGLDTYCQLKIVVSDEQIHYTKPRKIIVKHPLDQGA